ncbi:glutamine--tRNA ligase/YqeY domain fusion protein [Bacteroidetes bacterium endosymbiont of Geopemphigus sp.]|uniref:glutamine--tRNA ligase/YqeY domain fusion protein n=1 Tax=Bacteroidetes bacterium endosymbiont of Geopemphigus sp. TaxID=2047937 RepID=UPI000CCFF593|nr:glutamine--tRNA ligase/YqeY domain fusion protein [Bacteroidetes bacterium endosymbiont of Geopemphigus sp.]
MSDHTFSNFIEEIIENDLKGDFIREHLRFRFPPEPNGHLHIGHAKAICLNFGLSEYYRTPVNLRFDDTNPAKEEQTYVESIKKDIQWLGFRWNKECYTSDYFEQLYHWAQELIQEGKAYIDEQTQEEIIAQRKTPFESGIESLYRERPTQESLELFENMRSGKFEEGYCVLRAKIDMKAPNMNLRDPVMYRILKKAHQRTGKQWCIYPTYDWAHGQSDYIEQISHSLCSLEFDNHRPLYDWYLDQICKQGRIRPKQREFARLNLSHTIMSKRKLQRLIQEKTVTAWDDPRMPTLSGLRRRGYTAEAIRNFCQRIGIAKRENVIEVSLLEFSIREQLNKITPRVMAVLDPVKLIIENYPESQTEWLEAENNPEDPKAGARKIPFSKILYIEREDFMEIAPKKFFRLSIGSEIRLKNAYIIKGSGVLKDDDGKIIEIYAQYDPESRSGSGTEESLRKVKGTLHWVSAAHSIDIEARLYDQLFLVPAPEACKEEDFMNFMNPDSLKIVKGYGELSLKKAREGERFQFQRTGYFCVDRESSGERIVFNRTVTLKDSWAKENKNGPK